VLAGIGQRHTAPSPCTQCVQRAPQPFHVMVDRDVFNRDFASAMLRFHTSRYLADNIGIGIGRTTTGPNGSDSLPANSPPSIWSSTPTSAVASATSQYFSVRSGHSASDISQRSPKHRPPTRLAPQSPRPRPSTSSPARDLRTTPRHSNRPRHRRAAPRARRPRMERARQHDVEPCTKRR
jgi:hypothetical protein